MKRPVHALPIRQRGMSLIELMVGVVIGLIGMLVIFQTVTVWDSRTRATTAGGDAQTAGTIAMYNLERDVRLTALGFGTALAPELGCAVNGWDNDAGSAMAPFAFVPVLITDNDATGLPDELRILYGNSPYFVDRQTFTIALPNSVTTRDRVGFKAGDVVVVTDGGAGVPPQCNLVQVTDDATAADQKTLGFNATTYFDFYKNAAASAPRFTPVAGIGATYTSGGVFSLGPQPRLDHWYIANSTLGYQDQFAQTPTQFVGIAEGVIDLKAQYGYDLDGDGRIADGPGVTEWTKVLPVPTDWTKLRALRVAILVRSRSYEKPAAASDPRFAAANPTWVDGGNNSVNFVMRNVDGTAASFAAFDPSPNNWRNYRYTVYERVIPLRNVLWGTP